MGKICVAFNCQNKGLSKNHTVNNLENLHKISFFSFPLRNKERCKLWVDALRLPDWTPTISSRICSQHFSNDSFYEWNKKGCSLKEDAVPSIFDFPSYLTKECSFRSPEIGLELHCGLDAEVHSTDEKENDVKQQQSHSHILICSHNSSNIVLHSGVDEHDSNNKENDLRQSPLSGVVIQWEYIKKLYELQCNEGLHLGNKLRKAHVEWEKQKMKVRLAAQTLSSSVADSLLYCMKTNINGFKDCEETIDFIRHIDMLFDLLNSRSPFGKGSKSPLMKENKDYWSSSFTKAKLYLISLETMSGQKLFESKRKVGILGFLLDIESTWSLAEDLLWCDDCGMRYLLLHKFSQDHLETLFSVIRSRLGYNNNPSALQLQRALRSILIGRINYYSEGGNCQKSEEYLPDISFQQYDSMSYEESSELNVCNLDNEVLNMPMLPFYKLSIYVENVVEYICGYICRQLFQSLKCPICATALQCNTNWTTNDHFISVINRGGLFVPSKDVVTICSWAEKVIRQEQLNIKLKFSYQIVDRLVTLTMRHINMTSIFLSLHTHILNNSADDNHIAQLVKILLHYYLKIRLHYISKSFNEKSKDVSIRSKLNKTILFGGH